MLGGRVRWEALSVVGQLGDGLFSRINVQKAFLGAAGFTIESGPGRRDRRRGADQALHGGRRPRGHRHRRPHQVGARGVRDVLPDRPDHAVLTDDAAPAAMVAALTGTRHRRPARRPRTPTATRRRAGGSATATSRPWRADARTAPAAPPRAELRGHLQAVRGDPGPRRRLARPAAGRGPRARRRERRRQEHAGQDPRRRPPARQPARSCSTASRRRSTGPAQARALGIAVVHQEPRLFPDLTRRRERLHRPRAVGPARDHRLGRDAPGGRRRSSRSSTSSSTSARPSAACRWPTSS